MKGIFLSLLKPFILILTLGQCSGIFTVLNDRLLSMEYYELISANAEETQTNAEKEIEFEEEFKLLHDFEYSLHHQRIEISKSHTTLHFKNQCFISLFTPPPKFS